MKKLAIICILAVTIFASCKKDLSDNKPETQNKDLLVKTERTYEEKSIPGSQRKIFGVPLSGVSSFKRRIIDSISAATKKEFAANGSQFAKTLLPVTPIIPRPVFPRPPRPFFPLDLNVDLCSYSDVPATLTSVSSPTALIMEDGTVLSVGANFVDLKFQIQPELVYGNPYRANLTETYQFTTGFLQSYGQNVWALGCNTQAAPSGIQLCNVFTSNINYTINTCMYVYWTNGDVIVNKYVKTIVI